MATTVENRLTAAFINENAKQFTFRRKVRVPTNDGGWNEGIETSLLPQTGRFVQSGRVGALGQRMTSSGRLRDALATIVMMPGGDVQIGDLVDVPPHVAGDPGLSGEWEVTDITGRWAMNVEVAKHADT